MNNRQTNPEDQRRLLSAFVLSMLVLTLFYVLVTKPRVDKLREEAAIAATAEPVQAVAINALSSNQPITVKAALLKSPRLQIETPTLVGSLPLTGNRIDDLRLKGYNKTLHSTELVRLLAPSGTRKAYFLENGWVGANTAIAVPNAETVWSVGANRVLTPQAPVSLTWDNGQGITFTKTISIDDQYLFNVEQSVVNNTENAVTLYPYSLVSRTNRPLTEAEEKSFENRKTAILHTGPIAYLNDDLHETNYKDIVKKGTIDFKNSEGWIGITDKYWLVSLLSETKTDVRFVHKNIAEGIDTFQADSRGMAVKVFPNQSETVNEQFFAGAKKLDILNQYTEELGIKHLDLAIDFGWFYFFTKPFYLVLSFFGGLFQKWGFYASFGLAIMTLTVVLRALTYPLANKAFKSMSVMKKLSPQMKEIKEKHSGDRERLQKEIMEMYKREKVTPMGGCLPMFLQIPVFFALYKVLYVAIEMRHAPFYGWINDLSSPDPTNVFTLFGLISIDLPTFLTIGAWPIMYGLTLKLTQRMNPVPTDPVQKQVMMLMPIFFSYFFAQFPAGLVIYFVWSNILGGVQQYVIQKRMGMNPSFFRRRKAEA